MWIWGDRKSVASGGAVPTWLQQRGPCVMRSSILFKEIRNLTFVNGAPPSPFKYPSQSKRCRRLGLIPGLGRSPGRGNGNPLQYSFLENPMDRRAWQATVHGVTKSQTRLSDWAQSFFRTVLATQKTSLAPSLQPLVYYLSLPFGFLLHRVTCLGSALLPTVSGFNKWKNENRRCTCPPSRAPGSESIHWRGDGILSLPASFSTACWKGRRFPLNPTPRQPPQASLSSAPKSSQWPEQVLAGGPLWHHRDPALPGPCLQVQEHSPLEPHPAPSLLTMQSLKWCLFLPLCLSCGYAFMFSSLRDKPKETQGKVPCGGHFRIRQNLPEHTQSWLRSKWLWLSFIVVLYVILKFRGDSEKNKVRVAPFVTPHWFHLRNLRLRETRCSRYYRQDC